MKHILGVFFSLQRG